MPAVVLVPVGGAVDPECDDALRQVETQGIPVRRVRGYSAIDAARNQMATDALADGFDELFWVDSDVAFDPDDLFALRSHGKPFVCGLYPKKGPRQVAAAFPAGTTSITFGRAGGLVPVLYCGFGFVYTRRVVYEAVRERHKLPTLNKRFGRPLVPYFCPLWAGDGDDGWYLGEDYAFCERARAAGFAPVADTTVRLWHVGTYRYGWEDAGRDPERYGTYTFNLPPPKTNAVPPSSV